MTNEQREKITDLRHQGFGYTAIANSVGLSKDSVKASYDNIFRTEAGRLICREMFDLKI